MHVPADVLRPAVTALLRDEGLPPDHAANVADVLVEADLQGLGSHGVARLPQYLRQLRTGGLIARPHLRMERTAASAAVLHGDHALGPVAALRATAELEAMASEAGVAVIAVRGAGHVGPLSAYVERLASADLVALAFVNSAPAIAATGGSTPILGTNPIAFAVPGTPDPLVVDLSLSVAARGKILQAAKEGTAIPGDWAVDETGSPTTDPERALAGALLPIGGAKGFALALVVEVLSGVLAGGMLSSDLDLPWERPESRASTPGLFLLALDPSLLGSRDEQRATLSRLGDVVRATGGRLPGERRRDARRRNERDGIALPDGLRTTLREMGLRLPDEAP